MENTINEDKKWKILSSEYLVRRPWLTARRDVAELPDGRINHEYYVLEYLETKGVPVIGYGTEELPAFYTRHSGFKVDYRIDTPRN